MAISPALPRVTLERVPGTYAVLRLGPDEPVPLDRLGAFYSVTRTGGETSVVLPEEHVPPGALAEEGFALLRVQGELDFALTGIMAALTLPLAAAGISIFAISTFDTDYLLLRETQLPEALATLAAAGHGVVP